MISYEGLYEELRKKGITQTQLAAETGISSRTMAKIAKGERLSDRTLSRIALFLGCEPSILSSSVSPNPLLQLLRDEKENGISGGIYHEMQVFAAYNSNHIEGSALSEDETRMIFETNTIVSPDGIPVDDVLETIHHFKAFDYVIDSAEEELSENIIKHIHYILKHDTKASTLSWFNVGEYKSRVNMVGGHETTKPGDVAKEIRLLLSEYNSKDEVTIDDIISLHAEFEFIHPFQDGNGRVGRLVALKECLRHNIIPFIIEDRKKFFYYRGLAMWRRERGWLRDTCLDGQDGIISLLDSFGIPHQ